MKKDNKPVVKYGIQDLITEKRTELLKEKEDEVVCQFTDEYGSSNKLQVIFKPGKENIASTSLTVVDDFFEVSILNYNGRTSVFLSKEDIESLADQLEDYLEADSED